MILQFFGEGNGAIPSVIWLPLMEEMVRVSSMDKPFPQGSPWNRLFVVIFRTLTSMFPKRSSPSATRQFQQRLPISPGPFDGGVDVEHFRLPATTTSFQIWQEEPKHSWELIAQHLMPAPPLDFQITTPDQNLLASEVIAWNLCRL